MGYIYIIKNDINDKVYVGKTTLTLQERFKEHCRAVNRKQCAKRPLYLAMKKHGCNHFSISLLEETDDIENREIYWIQQYDAYHRGYNATLGGDGKRYLSISDEAIIQTYQDLQNMAQTAKTLHISVETVRKILNSHKIPIASNNNVLKKKFGKPIGMYATPACEKLLMSFESAYAAARYLIKENLTVSKNHRGIGAYLTHVCKGDYTIGYGYYWKWLDQQQENVA